ncbi:MAG: site-specific integrase [Gammaproteobacteria bacterium]|jgi:integrase/recombinase XerD|nr:site-specific integrase [Gammaproteobacteria bacterium]
MKQQSDSHDLAHLLQLFFRSYLINQRHMSKHTISAYRDAFRLYLPFLANLLSKKVDSLSLADLNAKHLIAFLRHLEEERGNSIATRNARLAAIRAFLNYAAIEVPDELPDIKRALAVPQKKKDLSVFECLDKAEIDALLTAPDDATWSGRRDRALLLTMYNTGARVSEIIGVRQQDLDLNRQHSVHLRGKGRKERVIPLWTETVTALRKWVASNDLSKDAIVFPNRFGEPLTRFGIRQRLQCACRTAARVCPSLERRNVTPHTLRHSTALHLLQAGVDLSVIALWLGHEQIETTHQYMEANLTMKKAALDSLPVISPQLKRRYQKPNEKMLAFLESL